MCEKAEKYAAQDTVGEDYRVQTVSPEVWQYILDAPLDPLNDRFRAAGLTLAEMTSGIEPGDAEWDLVETCPDLTLRQKECLYLHYWRRLSHAEAGRCLGIRKSVVVRHLERGRELLLRRLKPAGPDPVDVERFKDRMTALVRDRSGMSLVEKQAEARRRKTRPAGKETGPAGRPGMKPLPNDGYSKTPGVQSGPVRRRALIRKGPRAGSAV